MGAYLRSPFFVKDVGVYVAFSSSIAFVAGISIGHRKHVEPVQQESTKIEEPRRSVHDLVLEGERIILGHSGLKAVLLEDTSRANLYLRMNFYRLDTEHGKTAEIWMSKRYDGVVYFERRHG